MTSKDVWDVTLEIVKIAGAFTAFGFGLFQYDQSQKWKRREFVAGQMKDFEADKKIQAAFVMLDYDDRRVFLPSDTTEKPIILRVDDDLLCAALLPHHLANGYMSYEALIRDCFDRLFDCLVRLWSFVDSELVSVDELRPYVSYWMESIAGEKRAWHTPYFYSLLLNHMHHYGFDGATNLVKAFGYNADASGLQAAFHHALKVRPEAREEVEAQRQASQEL